MKIAIVGYGVEGQSSCDYFVALGHEVTVCDLSLDIRVPEGVATQLGEAYLDNLDRFDLIVRTAGMHPNIILEKNPGIGAKLTTQLNEFMAACPTKNILGITGTKGKGTTSTLIAKMLEAAGEQVFLGGNIGVPLFSFIGELTAESWVVLELSSFQLIDLKYSPHIGVCLMMVPEHLNWHADMAEYVAAKSQLFAHQAADDVAIYFAENETSKQIAGTGLGEKVPYFAVPGAIVANGSISIDGKTICKTDELQLLGAHNWQNACAAVTAAWQAGIQDVVALRSVLTSFTGLEHRLEFVRELDGVKYYDDSFGTTPETAIVAMQAFTEPKVVILGGSDKGASYSELAKVVKATNVRSVLLIGDQAPKIQAELQKIGYADYFAGGVTMEEIVANTQRAAQAGDVVLLSTGCASFGMFKDYKDRGIQFKFAVRALA
jgi:UDP-N-acetylmuramoylalanine--D-glutamate ligase